MERHASPYTIKQLAGLAGVSVRTLHHYDHLGLLRPARRSPAGYRLYTAADLLRLQQILFYREFGFPLEEIARLLDQPGFDLVHALGEHRQRLQAEARRLECLMDTIDRTIHKLTEEDMELTDAELYAGFTPEQVERYDREARERYDPKIVEESQKRLRKLSKVQWQAVKQEGEEITRLLAALPVDSDPGAAQVQQLIARHYAWLGNFYTVTPEIYRGLGELYTTHPEFRQHYEDYRTGLADFMQAAMNVYAGRMEE